MSNKEQYTSRMIGGYQCRCFEKLTEEEVNQLETKSVKVKYRKGEIICKQGTFASHVMHMERGLAKVYLDDSGNSLVLKIIQEGNMLGLTSVNEENNTFQYSAMAYVDSEIKQIDINFFKQLLNQNPYFAREIINVLSSDTVHINGRFFALTHKQSYGRLADLLICLSDRIFKNAEFDLPLSRKDLAELSGMSSETVIRMLKKFRNDGLILLEGKKMQVLDYPRLKRISETG